MKLYLLAVVALFSASNAYTQAVQKGTRSVNIYSDLYRTNQPGTLGQFQVGMEVGYQLNSRVSFNGGFDFWTSQSTPWLVLGNRFTPFDKAFIRYRALVGREAEVALGLGYQQPLKDRWLLSVMTDYYLTQHQIGLRVGLGYRWRDKNPADPAGNIIK